MTLLSYQVFKTVSDQGSFHKAADIMGLTPSAISHAISGMESELGYHLLTRSKSGISLTNYGEQLLPYVNAVLNSEESLKQAVAELMFHCGVAVNMLYDYDNSTFWTFDPDHHGSHLYDNAMYEDVGEALISYFYYSAL